MSRTPTFEAGDSEYQNVRVQISGVQEMQSVADPFHAQVKVTNRTGEEIAVTKVRWELPRSIVATRPPLADGSNAVTWAQGLALPQPEVLPNRSEQLFDLAMPAIHENWWNLPRNTRMMAFKPGEYPIKVRVEYTVGANRRLSVAEETVRVRFDTTPWFYIWGGILGSMIGVLFEFFYTAARGLDRYQWPRTERGRLALGLAFRDAFVFLFRWLLGGTAKWLTGSLTAAIVLLFLYYYKDVHLPITIQINDFFGAVVVGLVAHRLGLWVYDTLFARGDKPPGGPGPGVTNSEPFHFPQQVVPALTYPQRQ
jgi:hypothetical protein